MSTIRMNLTVDEDVPEMLAILAGGKREMGAWLSQLIREMYQEKDAYRKIRERIDALEERVARLEAR